ELGLDLAQNLSFKLENSMQYKLLKYAPQRGY
ncbi:hypothetical protein LCGC14_2707730, partial [marine sediment metagenome]